MADWAARDAACSSEQDDAAQRMKVFQRMVTVCGHTRPRALAILAYA
jgi:hypothetical protein